MSKVDLFIPTYNRPDFLKRLLTYYDNYNVKYRIIVADSSKNTIKKLNKKIVSKFNKLDILYLDKFSPSQVSHQKFGEMVKFAKAEYSVFCADDDFLVPNGIDNAVEFLDNNPDYIAAHGTYIAFYINATLPFLKKFLWRFIYPYQSINNPTPLGRLETHLSNYYQVLWAVRRTAQLKLVYSEFLKSKTSPVLFGELLPDVLTLVYGKMKRLDAFYSARQAFSTSYGYWPSLQDANKAGTLDQEYTKFKNCLIKNLNKLTKPNTLTAAKIIDKSLQAFFNHSTQEHLTGRVNLILKSFPNFFSNFLRQLHVFYLYSKRNEDRTGLIDNPTSKYFNDFKILRDLVLNN